MIYIKHIGADMAIEVDINRLTLVEKMALINGISLEAAVLLQKLFPNEPIINTLVQLKTGA